MSHPPMTGRCARCGEVKRLKVRGTKQGAEPLCFRCYGVRYCLACGAPKCVHTAGGLCRWCRWCLALSQPHRPPRHAQTWYAGALLADEDRQRRIELYTARAAQELPLFARGA